MDSQKRAELRKAYEEEISAEELLEMALIKKEEYAEGVYELVMAAVEKRGLEERLKGMQEFPGEVKEKGEWFEVYRYYDEADRDALIAFLVDKSIPVDVVSRECPAYEDMVRLPKAAGMVRVPERYFEAAKKVVTDFNRSCAPDDYYFVSEDELRQAIGDVLDKEISSPKEKIIEEIIKRFGPLRPRRV